MATKNMNIGSVTNATNVNVHLMGNLNYATCGTAAAAVAKVATVDASFPLTASCDLPEGFAIDILFSYANTATNPTLAISNGSATSKAYALKYEWGGPQIPSWASGDMVRLVLTSGGWLPEAALTPADEIRNGIVTTATQTFAGAKNVKNTVTASAYALSSVQGYGTAFPTAPVDGQIFFSLGVPSSVLYSAQTLTDAQKKQARDNIGALSASYGTTLPTSGVEGQIFFKTEA